MTMNGMRILSIVSAILSIVFLTVMVPGIELDRFTGGEAQFYTVGPRALPYFAGSMTLLLSVLGIFLPVEGTVASQKGRWTIGPAGRRSLVYIGILFVFVTLIPVVGFLIAAIAFLGATFAYFRAGSLVTSAVLAVAFPVGVDLLLRKVFMVPLPVMPFLS